MYHVEQMDKNSPDIEDDLDPSGKIAIWPSEELLKIAELEASFKKENQLPPKNFEDHTNLPQSYNEDGYNGHALDDPNHTWQRKQRPKSWTSPSTYNAQSPECVEERKRSSYHLESNVDMDRNYFDSISPSLLKSSHSAMLDLPNIGDSATDSRSNYVSMDNLPVYQRMSDAASRESQFGKSPTSQSHSADLTAGNGNCDNDNHKSRNELTTFKKGTPLYGQPAWWGEPDDPEAETVNSNKKSCASEITDTGNSSKSGTASEISQHLEKYKQDPKYACRYMEISHKDLIESENLLACRGSLSSSISKDSLISPDSRKGSLEIISDIGKKQPSSERELSVEKSDAVSSKVVDGGGTAFTVELGDMKPRKWNASGSLSEFMPSKIRKSFRERALKQSTKDGTPSKTVAEGDSPEGKTEDVELVQEKTKTKNSKSNPSSEEEDVQVKTKKDISPVSKNGPVPFSNSKVENHNNDPEEHTTPSCSGAASFLINKMFQGTSSGISPSGTNSNMGFEDDQKTEQDLYLEAREYSKKIFQESQSPESKELNIQEFPADQPLEVSEDKASETGTYTIEGDVEAKEEEIARKRIDNVFGVGQDIQRPVINAETQPVDKHNGEIYSDENLQTEDFKCHANDNYLEETPEKISVDDEKNISPETTQTPISESTVQSSGKTSADMDYRQHSESAGSSPLISKPPIGSARKRAGTGRKLPSLPPDNSSSPSSISTKTPQQQQISSTSLSKKDEKLNSADINKKPKSLISSSHGTTKNHKTKLDSDTDTNILLKDTEIAMAALEARVTSGNLAGTDDSESDISSSTNLREGVFRSRNRSTGERPGSRKSSLSDSSKVSSKGLLSSKERNPQIQRNYSKGSERGSVSSDVTSESEALETLSNTSDFSIDCDSDAFNRRGSKGKGGISMTRPNRAFQLRQAKARGTETSDKLPPHSGGSSSQRPSVVSKSSAGKVKRVNSVSLPTEKYGDSRRGTSVSGSDSIHKTTEGLKISSTSNFMRTDGGRYSLRATRSASTSSATKPNIDHRLRTDSKSNKPLLKSAHSTPGLNVVSLSSKNLSQSVNRSNSPRSSEKTSSKKRKEFSQRKQKSSSNMPSAALTDSKTSKSHAHKSVDDPSKTLANSRMVRSASLELSKYKNSDVPTDKSSSKSYKDVSNLGEDSTKYGFVPYCGYKMYQSGLQPEQSNIDYGEEERMQLPKSIQAVCKGSLAGFSCQSAFVPATKRKPHDTPQSTLNHLQSSCINSSSLKKKRDLVSLRQSCDRIIVSSIYRLSVKLKTATDRTVQRLRESEKASPMPFLTDDFMDQDSGEMPAWTSANRELAGILCNLRHIEHRVRVIDQALFPDKEDGSELDGIGHQRREKEKRLHYLQEIERIRTEIAGFQPIDNPEDKLWKEEERKMSNLDGGSNCSGEEELF